MKTARTGSMARTPQLLTTSPMVVSQTKQVVLASSLPRMMLRKIFHIRTHLTIIRLI